MKLIGHYKEWAVWQCLDGHLEGYLNKGGKRDEKGLYTIKQGKNYRLVTLATTMTGFARYIEKNKEKKIKYDPYKDKNQLQII